VLAGRAAEVERELVAGDRRAQAQLDVAVARLEHVARFVRGVGQRRQAGAHAPLGVVDRLRHRGLQAAAGVQLAQPLHAGPVGRELGAQVGAALGRLAHLRDQLVERGRIEPTRRDHHSLVAQRRRIGRHRAGRGAADVGVVRAVRREAELLAVVVERGRDDRDVGQVRAAAVGVVEHPRDVRGVLLSEHGLDRRRHRAEVHGDVLGLHHHPSPRVEQRAGGVAPLLDVGRVGGADQHGAHLLAGGAQGAGDDAQRDGVDAHGARSSLIVPDGSTRPAHPGGTASVASGSSQIAGPSIAVPGSGSPASTVASCSSPSNQARRALCSAPRPEAPAAVASISGPGSLAVTRSVTSSTSPSGSR
jgi:hypothetical protein